MPRQIYKDAAEDAEELCDAMKGWGTDETTLIEIICDLQPHQLEQVCEAYEEEYEKPLIKKVKSETGGDFENFLVGLLQPRSEFLLDTLKEAVDGLGTDERALIDCLVSCDARDINTIRESDVFQDIMDDVGGDFKRVLSSLFEADRDEMDPTPNLPRACKDAKRFYRAGEGRWGTNDRMMIQLLTKRSNAHLHLVDRIYQKVHDNSLETVVKSETSGAYEKALRAMLKPFDVYWAERCHKAMDGFGTDEHSLNRCLILCGKRRIPYVAAKYEELYEKTLEDAISGEIGGDYKKAVLKFIKPARKGTLGNPLKAFQEISLDDVDENGDIADEDEGDDVFEAIDAEEEERVAREAEERQEREAEEEAQKEEEERQAREAEEQAQKEEEERQAREAEEQAQKEEEERQAREAEEQAQKEEEERQAREAEEQAAKEEEERQAREAEEAEKMEEEERQAREAEEAEKMEEETESGKSNRFGFGGMMNNMMDGGAMDMMKNMAGGGAMEMMGGMMQGMGNMLQNAGMHMSEMGESIEGGDMEPRSEMGFGNPSSLHERMMAKHRAMHERIRAGNMATHDRITADIARDHEEMMARMHNA